MYVLVPFFALPKMNFSSKPIFFSFSCTPRSAVDVNQPRQIARDLMEDGRCGRSLEIAESLGIHVSEADPFWKDRAFLELNCAVSLTRTQVFFSSLISDVSFRVGLAVVSFEDGSDISLKALVSMFYLILSSTFFVMM